MWQNNIISDLSKKTVWKNGKEYSVEIGNDTTYKYIKESLPILKTGLQSVECFYMGTLDLAIKFMDQFEKSPETMKENYDYENIHCPYPKTLWEYSIPEGGRHGSKEEALFVIEEKDSLLIWPLINSPSSGMWLPGLYMIYLLKKATGEMKIMGPPDCTEEEFKDLEKTGLQVTSYFLAFLKILTCKNITQEVISPVQTRQMRRHGHKELYSYRILNVKPFGNHKTAESYFDSKEHNRVHFCRGHFKQFYPTKPLFGKLTGLYWWEPHLRGQDTSGFVDKDYEVKI